jgi:hypothetical protein
MNQSDTPKCDKCKSSFNMVNHDGEWICHSTHRLTELEEAVETKNMALETLSAIKEKYGLGSRNVMKELQCKVAELQKILNDCLYAMPCSYVPNHTVENLPAMIQNQTAMFAEEITRGESLEQQRDRLAENLERALNATVLNHRNDRWHIDAEYTLQMYQFLTYNNQ